jgi:hypothetical protein
MQKAAVQDGIESAVLFSWPSNRSSLGDGKFGFEDEEPTNDEMAANIHVLDSYPVVIGRSHDADIVVGEKLISRKHLEVSFDNDEWYVKDLNSSNGSTLNGKPLSNRRRRLGNGNVIELASSMRYIFQSPISNRRDFEALYKQEFHTDLPLDISRWNLLRLEHLGFSDLSGLFVSVETITRGGKENEGDVVVQAANRSDSFPIIVRHDANRHSFQQYLVRKYLVQGSIEEFPQRTEPHGLFGWWGHGINSFAFYYQIITNKRRVLFRLHFGGAYSNIDEDRNNVVEFLSSYAVFEGESGPKIESATLAHSYSPLMYEITLDTEDNGPPSIIRGALDGVSPGELFRELKMRVVSATN